MGFGSFLGNLVDKGTTAARKDFNVLGNFNPFNIDVGLSELLNGGANTANTGSAPYNARGVNQTAGKVLGSIPNLFNSQAQQTTRADVSPVNGPQQGPPAPSGSDFESALSNFSALDSGGSGGSAAAQHVAQYNGQSYDLNDPGQVLAYRQAIAQNLSSQREALLAQANDTYRNQSGDAANQISQALSQLDQAISDNQKSAKDFVTSHLRTVNQFNQDKSQGDVQRGQNFAALSPNAFQSSQGTSQQFANDQYLQGLGDLEKNAQDTVGLGYLQNPNDPSQLDQNSQFGRQQQGLGDQKNQANNSYNTYLQNLASGVANYTNQVNSNYTSQLDANANKLGIDAFQGNNAFSYSPTSYAPVQASQVDLSKYTPYTNTQSLTSVPQSSGGGYRPPVSSNPFTSQSPTDSYLNRTNTNLDQGQSDYLKKYLLGKTY